MRALADAPVQRNPQGRVLLIREHRGADRDLVGGIGKQPPAPVDHEDPSRELPRRLLGQRIDARRTIELVRDRALRLVASGSSSATITTSSV